MRFVFPAITAAAALTLSACATNPVLTGSDYSATLGVDAAKGQLDGPAIYNAFAGQTVSGGVNHAPGSWAVYNGTDGSGIFHIAGRRFLPIEWSIKGNRYCFSDPEDIEHICFDVFQRGGRYQLDDEQGVPSFYTTSIQPGDVYRMSDFLNRE